ncbi:MAG: hypothetical protein AAGJ29_07140 [Pseudomonadota bacterium]
MGGDGKAGITGNENRPRQTCLVVGAHRPLGGQIALALRSYGYRVLATHRTPSNQWHDRLSRAGIDQCALDLTDSAAVAKVGQQADIAVLTPILTVSAPAVPILVASGILRGVVFSSNNVAVVGPDPVYDKLRAAEARLQADAPDWAILRPTMIYGFPGDGNLSNLMRLARRLPVFPRLGLGRAKQQPIHTEDLARVAAGLAVQRWTAAGIIPVGGPDVLSHRQMVSLARRAADAPGWIIPVPTALARIVRVSLSRVGVTLPLSEAQLARIDLDKAAIDARPIPDELKPRISLESGLAALAADMRRAPLEQAD